MATGSNSNVSVTGNVQALSNAITVAIMSQQATPVSSPSVVATSGSASVQPGVAQPSPGNAKPEVNKLTIYSLGTILYHR